METVQKSPSTRPRHEHTHIGVTDAQTTDDASHVRLSLQLKSHCGGKNETPMKHPQCHQLIFKACIHVMGPLNAIGGLYTGIIRKSKTQVQTTAERKERRDFNRSEEVINDFA